jgi:hypothetical protein
MQEPGRDLAGISAFLLRELVCFLQILAEFDKRARMGGRPRNRASPHFSRLVKNSG